MAYEKRTGFGCTLAVDLVGDQVSYTPLGEIVDGWSTDATRDMTETTLLGETAKTYIAEQIDGGSVNLTIGYDPNDTGSTQILNGLFNAGTENEYQVTYSDVGSGTVTELYTALVESVGREIKIGTRVQSSVALKITGDPGLTDS